MSWLNFIHTAADISYLAEGAQLECKAAQGRQGRGEIPKDFWPTYSAFANTSGGIILLGVSEDEEGFHVLGIQEQHQVRVELWTQLNNREKVSANLLTEQDIQPLTLGGHTIIAVRVPQATRQQRPVYIGQNPLRGAYVRRLESDQLADNSAIERMMAEKGDDSRDDAILPNFGLDDLEHSTVQAYRNRFSAFKPESPLLELSLPDFLHQVGVTGRNRETGTSGLRMGGLLMFGKYQSILEACPNYMLDYRELDHEASTRWVDRLIPDGTWSGNVYDFFRRVYPKLVADLKIPFQLHDGQRIDDSPLHAALREALLNTLIHADYQGRTAILVIKRPDMFSFRNPGRMRIPIELAISGNHSDCRNRRIQQFFRHIGYVEQAGSGIPQIFRAWKHYHWQQPRFSEQHELDQTLMELHTSGLFPTEVIEALRRQLGVRLDSLSDTERTAMLLAQTEGNLQHARLSELCTEHSADISKMLAGLVRKGLLVPEGRGRGMSYRLPWHSVSGQEMPFGLNAELNLFDDSVEGHSLANPLSTESACLSTESTPLSTESTPLSTESHALPDEGAIMADAVDWQALLAIAEPYRKRKRLAAEEVEGFKTVILRLCQNRFLEGSVIAKLVDRNPDDLRRRFLNPMANNGLLERRHEHQNSPKQAYKTKI